MGDDDTIKMAIEKSGGVLKTLGTSDATDEQRKLIQLFLEKEMVTRITSLTNRFVY